MTENTSQARKRFAGAGLWAGVVGGALLCVVIGYILNGAVRAWHGDDAPTSAGTQTTTAPHEAKKPVLWTCSMHPEILLFKRGLCPKCQMALIPAETSGAMAGLRQLAVSEGAKALMDIETAPVERRFAAAELRMVGKVDFDETRLAYIAAWVPGRIDRLFVDYTGVPVRKGDHMVELYSPELLSAQEELLAALEAVKSLKNSSISIIRETTEATVVAAREKLRLWGLAPKQIAAIEKRGKADDHITINAPSSGIVIHKNAQQGMYVNTGTRIYTIADLTQVWVKLDAYESDLMWLRYGQKVEFTTVGYPGETFSGTISFIDPVLDPMTRSVKVRVNVSNADGRLKPEMFVKAVVRAKVAAGGKVMDEALAGKWMCPMHPAVIKDTSNKCDICGMPLARTESLGYVSADSDKLEKPLVVPDSAVLETGTRAIVYVELPDTDKPTFEGREIVLGPRAGKYYLVRSGLAEGERVVIRGNFKIDSALQIQAKPSMMTPDGGGSAGGHNHGGPAKKDPKEGAGKAKKIELPALFRHQVQSIFTAAKTVSKAVAAKDMSSAQSAFVDVGKAVKAVDMTSLKGHPHMLWMELSMRLTNDSVEGGAAKTLKEAQRIEGLLSTNVGSLRSKLGLGHAHASAAPVVSAEFRKQLAELYKEYFAVQQALADDKADGATEAAARGIKALDAVDMTLLTGKDHMAWMKTALELKKILGDAAKANEIEASRQIFALFSEQMAAVAKRFGPPGASAIYRHRCPMAFNNRGADWLQPNDKTLNPYFGAAMLGCGSVVEVIPARVADQPTKGEHQHD